MSEWGRERELEKSFYAQDAQECDCKGNRGERKDRGENGREKNNFSCLIIRRK